MLMYAALLLVITGMFMYFKTSEGFQSRGEMKANTKSSQSRGEMKANTKSSQSRGEMKPKPTQKPKTK
jgi:hypothetical protein